jgi:hypothetical protein
VDRIADSTTIVYKLEIEVTRQSHKDMSQAFLVLLFTYMLAGIKRKKDKNESITVIQNLFFWDTNYIFDWLPFTDGCLFKV